MLKTLKRTFLTFLIAYIGKYLIRAILYTCKIEVFGFEKFKKNHEENKTILMLWHNRLSIVSEVLYKLDPITVFVAFISKSRDGDPLSKLANSYKTGKAIRVAHNQRHQALKCVIDRLKSTDEVVIITPDGPRGPRYEVKPGIVVAALESKASITPFSWSSTAFWQLGSWDKLMFPKPFSKLIVTFGEPIQLQDRAVEENQEHLKNVLIEIETTVNRSLFSKKEDWPI